MFDEFGLFVNPFNFSCVFCSPWSPLSFLASALMGAKSVLLCLYLHTWRHSRLERELLFHRERFLCCCEPALPPKRPESGFLFPTHSINPLTYFSYTFNPAAQLKLTPATTTYLPVPYFLLKILKIFHKLEICLKREKCQIFVSHCPVQSTFVFHVFLCLVKVLIKTKIMLIPTISILF